MRARSLVLGTLATAIVLFVWQSVSNAALPWYQKQIHPFADSANVRTYLRAHAPTNGIYADMHGAIAIVSFAPDMHDQTADMGPMLGKQFALDVVLSLALCLLLGRLPAQRPTRTAATFALAGAAVTLLVVGSNTIWYGFPTMWTVVSVVDQGIAFALAGLTLRAIANRTTPRHDALPAGVVAEGGYRSTTGRPVGTLGS